MVCMTSGDKTVLRPGRGFGRLACRSIAFSTTPLGRGVGRGNSSVERVGTVASVLGYFVVILLPLEWVGRATLELWKGLQVFYDIFQYFIGEVERTERICASVIGESLVLPDCVKMVAYGVLEAVMALFEFFDFGVGENAEVEQGALGGLERFQLGLESLCRCLLAHWTVSPIDF